MPVSDWSSSSHVPEAIPPVWAVIGPALNRMESGCKSVTASSAVIGCWELVVLAAVVSGRCSAVADSRPVIGCWEELGSGCSAVTSSEPMIGCWPGVSSPERCRSLGSVSRGASTTED